MPRSTDRAANSYIAGMSRAFTREDDFVEDVPDRPVSSHPNFVTEHGLAQIDRKLESAQRAYSQTKALGDRDALARASRDLRYWNARRVSAQLVASDPAPKSVQFGSTVTIKREDGRLQTYRIVGEDEADPSSGSISHVSPLARALLGRAVGETVSAGKSNAEIIAIRAESDV